MAVIEELRYVVDNAKGCGVPSIPGHRYKQWLAEVEAMQAEVEKLRRIIEELGSAIFWYYHKGKWFAWRSGVRVDYGPAPTKLEAIEMLLAAEAKGEKDA